MGFGQYSQDGLGGPNHVSSALFQKTGRTRTGFGSHANTAHVWAQQTYQSGKSSDGRLFFRDAAIYSYGTHFKIAEFTNKKTKDGKSTFKGFAMQWIPWISDNLATSLPVFMIDFNDVKVAVLSGDYLHETVVKPAPNQHNDTVVWLDLTWQLLIHERRRHALIAKSDPVSDL